MGERRPPGVRVRRAVRRVRRALRPRAVVLCYHRVGPPGRDPQALCVRPERFAEHLERIARLGGALTAGELGRRLGEGGRLHRRVAVTFDDGYADNLHVALPLLRRHGVAATVFLATDWIESGRECWWDELERLLLEDAGAPGRVEIEVAGETVVVPAAEFPVEAGSGPGPEAECEVAPEAGSDASAGTGWTVLDADDPTPRHAAYRRLAERLRSLPPPEREESLERLREALGSPAVTRPALRPLTPAEVRELAESEGMEIGGHTAGHPRLAALEAAAQMDEIRRGRETLEAWTGSPPLSFAYPFGGRGDFDERSVAAVRETGFRQAFTTRSGAAARGDDPWRIPRLVVRDWSGEELGRRLEGILAP